MFSTEMNKIASEYEKNKENVTLRESSKYPGLFVLKYKKKVFYEGTWNDFLENARGLVLDEDFNVVSRPFLKIYNYGIEKQAPEFDPLETVIAVEKVNGFMVCATWDARRGLIVSSTGSLDSDFVSLGEKWVLSYPGLIGTLQKHQDKSFLFECCDPSDPHIVKEKEGLYFLGARDKENGKLFLPDEIYVPEVMHPAFFRAPFGEVQRLVKTSTREGFVVYSESGDRVTKIKSPHYLTKKLLMRKNMNALLLMDGKKLLDEEFYPILTYIQEYDASLFGQFDEKERRAYIEKWFEL